MPRRTIVDPHHHLWSLRDNRYAWLQGPPYKPSFSGNVAPIARDYLVRDFLAESTSVHLRKSVHIESGWDPADPVGETRWVQDVADAEGFPHGIVAFAELEHPNVERTLAAHASFRNMRGIRQILNWHPDPALTCHTRNDLMADPSWHRGYALLRKYGLSFDLQVYPWQMKEAAAVAARHPDTQMILNHAGMPIHQHGAGFETWRMGLRALAAQPNVSVKISGLGMVDWRWTTESIRPLVFETIDVFGIDRSIFASNFPVDRLYSSYRDLHESFEVIVSSLDEVDKNRLFSQNAERIYKI